MPPSRSALGHDGGLTSIKIAPNNALVVTAGLDKTVRVWGFGDAKQQRKAQAGMKATEGVMRSEGVYGELGLLRCQDGFMYEGGGIKWACHMPNAQVVGSRVRPWEFFYPERASRLGVPPEATHIQTVERATLAGMFDPDEDAEIYDAIMAAEAEMIDPRDSLPRLGQVVFAAPDVDARIFAREILRGRPTAPPWLAEGLAGYFESTARGKGGFETGVVAGRGAKDRLRDFKRLLDAKPPWSADAVVRLEDPEAFYGEGAGGNYAASWVVVHALFHAEGGRHAEGFARYIEGVAARGSWEADALYAATGLDAAGLTSLVTAHARTIDPR